MTACTIELSKTEDIDTIFSIYKMATEIQREKKMHVWMGFERSLIEQEIKEERHWKVLMNNQIAGVFCLNFSPEDIWRNYPHDSVFYIHRLAKDSDLKFSILSEIINWAKSFARSKNLRCLRLDTFSDNKELIAYYVRSGFDLKGVIKVNSDPNLPLHYQNASLALLEMNLVNG